MPLRVMYTILTQSKNAWDNETRLYLSGTHINCAPKGREYNLLNNHNEKTCRSVPTPVNAEQVACNIISISLSQSDLTCASSTLHLTLLRTTRQRHSDEAKEKSCYTYQHHWTLLNITETFSLLISLNKTKKKHLKLPHNTSSTGYHHTAVTNNECQWSHQKHS